MPLDLDPHTNWFVNEVLIPVGLVVALVIAIWVANG